MMMVRSTPTDSRLSRSDVVDFNALEIGARDAVQAGQIDRAIAIYIWMGTGDPSLDGGYLGQRLGECYEAVGQPYVARYWYTRALEENPQVNLDAKVALDRLDRLDVADLLKDLR